VGTARPGSTAWSAPVPLEPQAQFVDFAGADFGPSDLSLVVDRNGELFEAKRDSLQSPWHRVRRTRDAGPVRHLRDRTAADLNPMVVLVQRDLR